jgi:ABC-type transport system substrate-binding protein
MTGYWQRILAQRVSRRRALAAGAATTAAAAFLVACGSDDETPSATGSTVTGSTGATGGGTGGTGATGATGTGAASGLLTPITDTSSSAKQGGVMAIAINADLQSLDPNFTTSGSANAPFVYSRLFMYEPGTSPEGSAGVPIPDAAEGAEVSPDGLTITVKLRQNVKFDERPPTSGRTLTADDVKYSWDSFAANNSSRGELVYNAETAANAPIESMDVLDDFTVQFNFRTPVANPLSLFGFQRYMWLLPREADGQFDARQDSRGSSAWKMTKWEPSVGFTYERNASWHLDPPFLDGIQQTIVSEYAARRSQFVAGNLWTMGGTGPGVGPGGVRAEDVVATKNEKPELAMYADAFPEARRNVIGFSYRPSSPFHDERIRRAVSMLIDRDPWIDAFYNVSSYEAEGLPVEARWDSHYMAGEPPYWIDPKGNGLGEGAAYFQHNPEEAAKLIEASGLPTPIRIPGAYNVAYAIDDQVASLTGMLVDSGLFEIEVASYDNQIYNQTYHLTSGDHDGLVMGHSMCQSGDINNHISCRYAVGSGARVLVPETYPWYNKVQDLMVRQRSELDNEVRLGLLTDIQKELALWMPAVPWPGAANGFSLAWPYMANYGTRNPRSVITAPSETWQYYWYDASKA